jgi:5-formyltetrahydrofolate cyclo-ligase
MAAPHLPSPEVIEAKRAARARARSLRAACDPALGAALTAHVLRQCAPPAGAVVSGFWPMGEEIDIRPLLHALHERSHPIVLPVTPKRGEALSFRVWRPGDVLVREKFGTMRPTGDERVPTFLLVPLLAFDRSGHRLGYGGGYYDRTLSALRDAFALGCAYAAQEVDELPVAPYDVRLDAVATERGVIFFKDR